MVGGRVREAWVVAVGEVGGVVQVGVCWVAEQSCRWLLPASG